MTENPQIDFGDNVRVLSSPVTSSKGLAGLNGKVYGWTTPSSTGVEVIGELKRDYAINVYFEERKEGFWFAEELIVFIDHGAGTEVKLDGVPKKWIRTEDGQWKEFSLKKDNLWTRFLKRMGLKAKR